MQNATNKDPNWVSNLFLLATIFFLPVHLIWFAQTPVWFPLRCFLLGLPITFFMFIPAFLFPKIAKTWAVILSIIFIPAIIFSVMYVYFFNAMITEQSLFAIFETSYSESHEFLQANVNFGSILCLLMLIVIPIFFIVRFLKQEIKPYKASKISAIVLIILCIILFSSNRQNKMLDQNIIIQLIQSYKIYKKNIVELNAYMEKMKNSKAPGVKCLSDDPITLLVVIGESSNRHHWGIYNYFRNTTPKLNSIKDQLLIFNNSISAWARTTTSVSDAMTCKGIKDIDEAPLVNIFKQAGFETIWISNQNTVDNSNAIVCLVSGADKTIYLNRGGDQCYARVYDEQIFPVLKEILEKEPKNKKRVIFIHTMGSHVNYASRYPDNYAFFKNEDEITEKPWFGRKAKKYINDYDNTIYYTDYIICEFINMIRKEPGSALLFFSDHGEECFDSRNQHGHHDSLESRFYFEIPFFIWLSDDYKSKLSSDTYKLWQNATNKPFVNYAAYSILNLANITLDCDSLNKSPLSENFKEEPRIVHGKDFDEYFK